MKLPITATATALTGLLAASTATASNTRHSSPTFGLRGNAGASAKLPNVVAVEGEDAHVHDEIPPHHDEEEWESHNDEEHHDEGEWEDHHDEEQRGGEEHEEAESYEADDNEGTGANGAHYAAHIGDMETLVHIIENERADMVHEPDANGWLPIHEGVRSGHVEIIKTFVENGVDVNARTSWGEGHSALALAEEFHEDDHPLIEYLLSVGAESFGPEL